MSQTAIIEAFAEVEDRRRKAGQRHTLPLCLALFTLAIAAGNKGFLAIGDWVTSYREQLIDLFKPPKNRLPSYSTLRRALLHINYEQYSACLAKFFNVHVTSGETVGVDGKVLKLRSCTILNKTRKTGFLNDKSRFLNCTSCKKPGF